MPEQTCPKCKGQYVYQDRDMLVCPECAHEWSVHQQEATIEQADSTIVQDAVGNELADGDNAVMAKDVKMRRGSDVLKQGTKVQNIKLEENGPHNIIARVDGFGIMELKSELVKKIN